MPEVRECSVHYIHTQYVLVEKLGLGQNQNNDWRLLGLFADATDKEAGIADGHNLWPCLTDKHARGYVDRLDLSCTLTRGQTANQTRIWPGTPDAPEILDGLVLSGLSHTPRALILKFGRLDLEVWFILWQ